MNINELQKEFNRKKKSYNRIKENCDNLVLYEEWATGYLYDLEPLEAIRLGQETGKKLKKKPAKKNGKIGYFFTGDKRVLIRRTGTEFPDQFYEEFFDYKVNIISSVYFGATKMKELINIKSRLLENGKIIETLMIGKKGNRKQRFHYEDDRVVLIDVEEYARSDPDNISRFKTFVYYDESNNINIREIENIFPNKKRVRIYPC